jgi:putative phosphoribosyl transferase
MLADLLTVDEERHDAATGALRFDIGLLAHRVVAAIDWLRDEPATARRPLGLFGASTGAAAALTAATHRPEAVRAVVSRGGRPDLTGRAVSAGSAGADLALVRAPTLLIVGERDELVARLNQRAADRLRAAHMLRTVPGATHLFEEPGALEQVAGWAAEWFDRYVAAAPDNGVGRPREGGRDA